MQNKVTLKTTFEGKRELNASGVYVYIEESFIFCFIVFSKFVKYINISI